MTLHFVRKSWANDEDTDIPCAICHNPGNRSLYKCNHCGRWVCEWDCMVPNTNLCKECVMKGVKDNELE